MELREPSASDVAAGLGAIPVGPGTPGVPSGCGRGAGAIPPAPPRASPTVWGVGPTDTRRLGLRARCHAVGVLAVAGTLLVGCGDAARPTAGNPTDRAFAAQMIPHHESAVAMARVAERRGSSAFVKELAADIVRAQGRELGTLRERDADLARRGIDVGTLGVAADAMAMGGGAGTLRDVEPFDPAFLRMMLPHHAGAVAMARAELERGADPRLAALARAIIRAQEREMREMRQAR